MIVSVWERKIAFILCKSHVQWVRLESSVSQFIVLLISSLWALWSSGMGKQMTFTGTDMVWCYSGLKIDECNLKSCTFINFQTRVASNHVWLSTWLQCELEFTTFLTSKVQFLNFKTLYGSGHQHCHCGILNFASGLSRWRFLHKYHILENWGMVNKIRSTYHLFGKPGNSGKNSNGTVHSSGNFPEKR